MKHAAFRGTVDVKLNVGCFHGWFCFLEAIQVELANKAGEVGGFKSVYAVHAVVTSSQDEFLKEPLVNNDDLSATVPADGQ